MKTVMMCRQALLDKVYEFCPDAKPTKDMPNPAMVSELKIAMDELQRAVIDDDNIPKNASGFGLDTNSLMFLLRALFVEGETVNPNEYPSLGFAQAYAALEKAARDTVMHYPHIPPLVRKK